MELRNVTIVESGLSLFKFDITDQIGGLGWTNWWAFGVEKITSHRLTARLNHFPLANSKCLMGRVIRYGNRLSSIEHLDGYLAMASYVAPEIKYTQLFINNEYVNSCSGKTFPVINPSDEREICHVPKADAGDVSKAVAAAKAAFQADSEWRTVDAFARGLLLFKLSNLVEQNADYIARLETLDNGKVVKSAVTDVQLAIRILRFYAAHAEKLCDKETLWIRDRLVIKRRMPSGVTACFTFRHYPFLSAITMLAPCLAAGCTVVLKPWALTSLTTIYLGSLIEQGHQDWDVFHIRPIWR